MSLPTWLARVWGVVVDRARAVSDANPLVRTFLLRFYENDLTGGSSDLRSSFFWTIAFFGAPGALIPVMMSFDWEGVVMGQGLEMLRVVSRADKVLYLGLAMISSGVISASTWSSLLLDRRDCLVLGILPVPGPRIVRAKLAALCIYVAIMAVGIHTVASFSYGFVLGARNTLSFLLAGIVAHMVASCAAAAFVMFAVAALQGVFFAAFGPRRFAIVSTWLHSLVVMVTLVGLLMLPAVTSSVVDTLAGTGRHVQPWILYTPPLWFLGIYESVIGTGDQQLHALAAVGVLALGVVCLLTFVAYPLAYRRLVAAVAEMPKTSDRRGWAGRAVEAVVVAASVKSATRAASQFYLTAFRRSGTHKLAVAVTLGVTAAVTAPTVVQWAPQIGAMPASAPIVLLGLPFQALLFLIAGLRVSASLPVDLRSGWMLDSIGASPAVMRAGVWRSMFVAAVVPVAVVVGLTYGHFWGIRFGLIHALLCVAIGATLIEMSLWGFDGMPCTRPWRPERANLRKWWPAYLCLFALVSTGVPAIERLCLEEGEGLVALFTTIAAIGILLRITHRRRTVVPEDEMDEPATVQVLNLD